MTEQITPKPDGTRPERSRKPVLIALIIAGVLAIGAAIAIPVSVSNANAAAEAERVEAERVAAEEAEQERLDLFDRGLKRCGIRGAAGVTVLDGGEALELDGVGLYPSSKVQLIHVECILDQTQAPAAVASRMGQTRALDGRQSEEWDGFEAEWSYHPDSGMNVIFEHAR